MKSKFFVTLHPKMKIIVTQHAMKEINYVWPTLFAYLVWRKLDYTPIN